MSIVENVKEIADLIKKIGDIDLYRRIIGLEQEVFELNHENIFLKQKISTLEDINEIASKMEFKSPFWYMNGDFVPYCPQCWENNKKTIHLIDIQEHGFECPSCNKRYVTVDGKVVNIRIK